MQQHLMQMQPMMAGYYPGNVTSDHIQQYLDENKSLILKIVESQNSGKLGECAENQARLQRNLMYLAAIADSQPQPPSLQSQYASGGGMIQPGASHYLQNQTATQMTTPQALMAARSSMLYGHQQQHQPYATSLHHSQLGMSSSSGSGGGGSGLHILQGEVGTSGGNGGFHDFGRGKPELGIGSGGFDGRGGSSGDGGDTLYLKSSDEGN
ncbi:PREDICTED: GRF1-interacting factor 1 isoform X2 [Tarenaya hassleriana]|uniref:GRF1-interacting factor 1 isoform X2 n=1 Tax=Tarenaya hassleriana TaxID=28532 RepID=UPI00053C4C5B|nr:PREDICTED: GRF1-interacting factor 1 isoform X2 [Tarenaya hassleriana]